MATSARDDSDATLLGRLHTRGDSAAVAEVVRRYGGLVYGTCLRRQPPDPAAETCAAVFQTLVARPAQVAGPLPVWLHAEVMTRTGHAAGCVPLHAVGEWRQIAPVVDLAIAVLELRDREQVLMEWCLSPSEAVRLYGDPADAEAIRRDAARQQMAAHLAATGVSVSPAQLAAAMAAHAITLPPAEVASRLACLALEVIPRRLTDTPSAAENRVRVYLMLAIAVLVMVVLVAGLVYVLSDTVADRKRPHGTELPTSSPPAASRWAFRLS